MDLINFSNHHIDVKVTNTDGLIWRCTFIYAEPIVQDRPNMWKLLQKIKPNAKDPWLMIGDFNEKMWQHEHLSMTKRNVKQMEDFQNVLSDCNLQDLGYKGRPWTYDNKREGHKNV
jgi:hypothetical protein